LSGYFEKLEILTCIILKSQVSFSLILWSSYKLVFGKVRFISNQTKTKKVLL